MIAAEIIDWAAGDLNWEDVEAHAVQVAPPPALTPDDFQEGWVNGPKRVAWEGEAQQP